MPAGSSGTRQRLEPRRAGKAGDDAQVCAQQCTLLLRDCGHFSPFPQQQPSGRPQLGVCVEQVAECSLESCGPPHPLPSSHAGSPLLHGTLSIIED